ncbi:MAG: restriction endonuclease [Planctomycetota bacterium]|jgi:restriction system protein|nr:restriction endonuclease [Planctomycetota bacterium]
MAVWLVRAGLKGEQEDWAIEHGRAVIGWSEMKDLSDYSTPDTLLAGLRAAYPEASAGRLRNWRGQLWAFARRIEPGDLVVLPLRGRDIVAVGKVLGDYEYVPQNPEWTKHTRPVQWIHVDLPRSRFDQDLLYSFGAFMTVCQIKRNNAEERIRAIVEGRTPPLAPAPAGDGVVEGDEVEPVMDVAEYAATQIRLWIAQKFAGHALADLVNAILEAQGYVTEVSPPGPDGGVDIIAGRGPMGFDPPRLLVQVKSGDGQQDVKVLRELRGVMQDFKADQGLFVAWGGFRRPVLAEARKNFFELRLWDAGDVVENVLRYYDSFPEELKADLPLKRIWVLVQDQEA